jgi:hypothetical protein
MYVHINLSLIRLQAYENKTWYMFNKTIDDEEVCACVYVLWINITKDNIFLEL